MIRSLTLDNYRGFRNFELHDLGRVNLIVGTNNSGKTSVLEAVNLLTANGDMSTLWATLWRRGESVEDREGGPAARQIDIRRLFHGHAPVIGCKFSLASGAGPNKLSLMAEIIEPRLSDEKRAEQQQLFDSIDSGGEPSDLQPDAVQPSAISITWDGHPPINVTADVTRKGGVAIDIIRRAARQLEGSRPNVRFITASSLSPEVVIDLFEEVVLTPDEDLVIDALNIIEPSIERIATSGTDRWRSNVSRVNNRGGLLLRCKDNNDRIPIGSMGDGIWRLLGLALSLVRSENGILLIDEIDTGLHYSVMEKMWKLVTDTARRLNIQVFVTTHSRDCYESLAVVCHDRVARDGDISIQRIERGKARSVAYSEQEIIAAAQRGMEVR